MHFIYHYIYQDVYIPVWPNIVASILIGAWVIWRNRTHIDRLEHRLMRHMSLHNTLIGKEIEKIHEHVSKLHTSGLSDSGSSDSDTPLFAHQEIERSGNDAG